MESAFSPARIRFTVLFIVVCAAAVGLTEFGLVRRPELSAIAAPIREVAKAPPYGLKSVQFNCADHGFVTSVQIAQSASGSKVSDVHCEDGLTVSTTRCPSSLPFTLFGDRMQCPQAEAIHCHGGPLQTLGLFEADSFCGDVSDRDLGPPEEAPRAD